MIKKEEIVNNSKLFEKNNYFNHNKYNTNFEKKIPLRKVLSIYIILGNSSSK